MHLKDKLEDFDISKNTCWYKKECYPEMIKGAQGILWPKLQDSLHWPVLEDLLKTASNIFRAEELRKRTDLKKSIRSMHLLDIGCGAAALSETEIIRKYFLYYGLDIPKVIKNVAKKLYEDNAYISCDLLDTEVPLENYTQSIDIVVMNAFIDVMQEPLEVLAHILGECKNFVIIHRQRVCIAPTDVKKKSSYGHKTYVSYINEMEFENCIRHFKIVKKLNSRLGINIFSYLLMRKVDD